MVDLLSPLFQFVFVAVIMMVTMLVFRFLKKPLAVWNYAALLLVFYAVLNSTAAYFAPNYWNYLLFSVLGFLALYFLLFLLAPLISGKSYDDYGDNAMLLTVPAFFFIVLWLVFSVVSLF